MSIAIQALLDREIPGHPKHLMPDPDFERPITIIDQLINWPAILIVAALHRIPGVCLDVAHRKQQRKSCYRSPHQIPPTLEILTPPLLAK